MLAANPASKPFASPVADAFLAAKTPVIMEGGAGERRSVTPATALAKPVPLAKASVAKTSIAAKPVLAKPRQATKPAAQKRSTDSKRTGAAKTKMRGSKTDN